MSNNEVDSIKLSAPLDEMSSRGTFTLMEIRWAKSLKEGDPVQVKISPVYEGNDPRPVRFEILHKTGNGGWVEEELENKAGG